VYLDKPWNWGNEESQAGGRRWADDNEEVRRTSQILALRMGNRPGEKHLTGAITHQRAGPKLLTGPARIRTGYCVQQGTSTVTRRAVKVSPLTVPWMLAVAPVTTSSNVMGVQPSSAHCR
jgi:hypothetical protein